MDTGFDAYRTLQIDPNAEDFLLEVAYRALAKRYHPDGDAPDETRMAVINRAYDLLRTPVRRRKYDREHRLRAVGPGLASVDAPLSNAMPASGNGSNGGGAGSAVIDFGRYRGWSLKDLAKHDPDYLRWLARSSGGVRYRNQIHVLLPDESELASAKF